MVIHTPTPATAGEEIQKLRLARGLSQNRLAQIAGISAAALSRWESGKRMPSIPELEEVLTALEASPAQRRAVLRRIDAPRALHRLRALDNTGSESCNGRGQLLRAMRHRKGWTQAAAAAAARVTQAQIARWENGDAWPGAADLHRLCWSLGAGSEEVAALTQKGAANGFLLSPGAVHTWDEAQWMQHLDHLLFRQPPEALFALTFISVQEHLSRLAEDHAFAAAMLPTACAIYARHCLQLGQNRQAAHVAERGLALVRRQLPGLVTECGQTIWFGNVIVLATQIGKSRHPTGIRRAARLLREWLPAMQRGKESQDAIVARSAAAHHAWGQIKLCSYWNHSGHTDEALALGRAACEEGIHVKPSEGYMRLRDMTSLLLEAKAPLTALRVLSESEALIGMDTVGSTTRARHFLLEAHCLIAAGAVQNAGERVSAAEAIITEEGLLPLQTELQEATALVSGKW